MPYNDIDETVKLYFKSLKDIKSLSKKEEHELIKKYREKKDIKARDKVIEANLKYTCKIAHNYRDRGVDFSFLISEANDALIEALDKFDINRDVKLMSYAKWWVMQRLQTVIENHNRMPMDEIPQEYVNYNMDDFDNEAYTSREYFNSDESLTDNMDEENNAESQHKFIQRITKDLNDREREMIFLYYGLGGEEYNLEDIGLKYSLTKERVRQIIETGFKKIRSASILIDSQYIAR